MFYGGFSLIDVDHEISLDEAFEIVHDKAVLPFSSASRLRDNNLVMFRKRK